MNKELPIVYLARQGDTAWSVTGQHTGLTDLPLTERGAQVARSLGRLQGGTFTKVYTSSAACAGLGDVLVFSSGHFIRMFVSRWLGLEPSPNARCFMLSTASLSAVGYENDLSRPVIRLWNDTHHVAA